uniref:Uncharacterized protein n=1 Tax=Rhizophora mucronata TaxID=61149 RepID=A0A2P2PCB2_RHIMU
MCFVLFDVLLSLHLLWVY